MNFPFDSAFQAIATSVLNSIMMTALFQWWNRRTTQKKLLRGLEHEFKRCISIANANLGPINWELEATKQRYTLQPMQLFGKSWSELANHSECRNVLDADLLADCLGLIEKMDRLDVALSDRSIYVIHNGGLASNFYANLRARNEHIKPLLEEVSEILNSVHTRIEPILQSRKIAANMTKY